MFEQNFEHEDRYTQQGRRSQSPYADRRNSRGYDDRYENQDRNRYRGQDSDRRYTRPDYDSDLDIERPGQAHFGSRGSSEYGRDREYDQENSWQRSNRSQQRHQDRYSSEGSGRSDLNRGHSDYGYGRGSEQGRGSSDYGRGTSDYGRGMSDYSRGSSDYGRDWQGTGSGMGHADWNRFGSEGRDQDMGRRSSSDQQDQQSHNEQRHRWPKSYKRSDERLKDDIHEELIRHGRIDASDIEVQVKDGEVTLTGQVSSRQDKRTAEELAEKVLGVHDVQNQLRVRSQQGQNSEQQKSGGSPNLPGSNRMSVAGQQQDQTKSAANSSANK